MWNHYLWTLMVIWWKIQENWPTFNFGLFSGRSLNFKRPLHNVCMVDQSKKRKLFLCSGDQTTHLCRWTFWSDHFNKYRPSLDYLYYGRQYIVCKVNFFILKIQAKKEGACHGSSCDALYEPGCPCTNQRKLGYSYGKLV